MRERLKNSKKCEENRDGKNETELNQKTFEKHISNGLLKSI